MASGKWLLVVLTAIMVFNYVDRVAMGLLLQTIKGDLDLTDTQLGFLTGIAFAAFYAVMGIPIARWADRGNRVTIISLTVVLWSTAVALCATARNFLQILVMRIGVAVGEAGCHPPAFSLISEHFDREQRPRAIAVYMLGFPLALLLGNFAAGWLNEAYGWRWTFVLIALPGILLAVLARLTLREPRQLGTELRNETRAPAQTSVKEVIRSLWFNVAFRNLLICHSLSYFFGNGILQWQPAFFVRSYGVQTGELGTWFALIYGVGGLVGLWLGGQLAARYAAKNERLQLIAVGALYALLAVVSATVYLTPHLNLALLVLSISAVGSMVGVGPLFAATQTLVPPRMRAMSVALILFFANLVGLGLGPLAVGTLSDLMQSSRGAESLRYALLAMCPGYFLCSWYLWRASRTVETSLQAVAHEEKPLAPLPLDTFGPESKCPSS